MKDFSISKRLTRLMLQIFSICFICFISAVPSYSYNKKIFLLTSDRGILVSGDSGRSWSDFNRGLPDRVIPLKIYPDKSGNLYLLTNSSGIFKFISNKNKWQDINSPEFLEPAFLSNKSKPGYRKISAFAVDEESGRMLLATKHAVFQADDGAKWSRMPEFSSDNYYTAFYVRKDGLYAGTSCNGIFMMRSLKKTELSNGLPMEQYSKKRWFREEVSAVAFSKDIMYAAFNFCGGIFSRENGSWKKIALPSGSFNEIYDMKIKDGTLFVSSESGIYKMENNKWDSLHADDIRSLASKRENLAAVALDQSGKYPPLFFHLNNYSVPKKSYADAAKNKKALYTNSYSLNKNLGYYIDTIKKCRLNSIVIDMKDDWGDVCFDSKNKTAIEIGAVKKYADVKKALDALKKNGIYTIARIVVFKDKRLYNSKNNEYAIWDLAVKSPWKGNPKEFWNDPYSDFVRKYNIDIAEEAAGLGFDEIQFDYIRFPSDGPVDRCYFRHKKNNDIYKSEILSCFLSEARNRINKPVSVDIYGFNAWFRISELIGQDEEKFAEIVDVICPMAYPSHYGMFFGNIEEGLKPKKIVLGTAVRSEKITMNNALIRPYIQAFRLHSPTWGTEYINSQIRAIDESGCGGYILWNAGGNYDMVKKAAEVSGEK